MKCNECILKYARRSSIINTAVTDLSKIEGHFSQSRFLLHCYSMSFNSKMDVQNILLLLYRLYMQLAVYAVFTASIHWIILCILCCMHFELRLMMLGNVIFYSSRL